MIIAGHLLLSCEPEPGLPARCELRRGWLRVDGGKIVDVQTGDCPHAIELGGDDCIIAPGFIDTHLHLPQFDCIGREGLSLLDWLEQVIFPAETRWADPVFAADMTQRAVEQLFAHGTTSFCAYATVHHPATCAACEIIDCYGIRAAVGHVLMDRDAPVELCRPAGQLIEEAAALLARYPAPSKIADGVSSYKSVGGLSEADAGADSYKKSRLEFAITPRFVISCSDELLAAAGKLAHSTGAIVQTHLAENPAECEIVRRRFGCDYTNVYERAGLLGPRTILGHGIHLSDAERPMLVRSRSVIAHCPTANLFLQSGFMPRARWLADGLRISLGSDIGAGTERSMIRVARAMIDAAKTLTMLDSSRGDECSTGIAMVPTAAEAWYQITAGNADAVGWTDVGRIQLGNSADLLLIRPDIAWRNAPDPLSVLLYAWDDRWLRRTLVVGREVYNSYTSCV